MALRTEILRAEVGSTLHGVGISGYDDRDEMGVCLEDPEFVIGLSRFEQYIFRTQPPVIVVVMVISISSSSVSGSGCD